MQRPDCTHTEGKFHDCDYVDARNQWVKLAESWADSVRPEPRGISHNTPEYMRWEDEHDIAYLRAMEILYRDGETHADGVLPPRLWELLLPDFTWTIQELSESRSYNTL